MAPGSTHVNIAVVGGGFAGLGAAIRLKQSGFNDFVVLEKSDDVGGTWRDNTYPGCACDVPSHLYSYSFAPNPQWTHVYSRQPEIWAYLRDCAKRFDVMGHVRFGYELVSARWDGTCWRLNTPAANFTADVLVAATGPLSEPHVPALAGLDSFAGTAFHSARWNHAHDLSGRTVAVVGTGASAAQFVPEIAPQVDRLVVFQRTPPWVLPRGDRELTADQRRRYESRPAAQRWARTAAFWSHEALGMGLRHPWLMRVAERAAHRHLRRSVPDPDLRAALTPDYRLGCKRVVLSDDYLPALARPNVSVVTEAIQAVRPRGLVTVDGREHRVDTVIFGTGFRVIDHPMAARVRGRDGRTLADVWQGSPRAYLGTTVAGFPNLFLLLGPNTGLGHNSVVYMAECQLDYLIEALSYRRRTGAATVEPTAKAQQRYVSTVDRKMRGTVWVSGCDSWYLDRTGRNSTLWPGGASAYRRRLARFNPRKHLVGTR